MLRWVTLFISERPLFIKKNIYKPVPNRFETGLRTGLSFKPVHSNRFESQTGSLKPVWISNRFINKPVFEPVLLNGRATLPKTKPKLTYLDPYIHTLKYVGLGLGSTQSPKKLCFWYGFWVKHKFFVFLGVSIN